MTLDPLVLFMEAFWQSPWDCACYVALREKDLPFGVSTGFLSDDMGVPEPLRAQGVAARIPMLQHGDFWLSDSVAIVEYLEETFPPPGWARLLPTDPRARARARQLTILTRLESNALRRERPASMVFYPSQVAEAKPLSRQAAREAAVVVDTATRLLQGEHLFGEFTIADLDLAFALMRLMRTGHEVPEAARVYAERIWTRPPVRDFVTHQRPPNPPAW